MYRLDDLGVRATRNLFHAGALWLANDCGAPRGYARTTQVTAAHTSITADPQGCGHPWLLD
jgi:hypothetical protein